MIRSRLRLYVGPEDNNSSVATASPRTVTVPAGDIMALLADAAQQGRAWLSDFEDDEMTISTDLYEVLLAYEHFRRPSA